MSNKRNHYYTSKTSTESKCDPADSFVSAAVSDSSEEVVEALDELNSDTAVSVESETNQQMPICVVVNCHKLNIRPFPSTDNTPVCVVSEGDPLVLNKEKSTDDWYAVYTEAGVEGFCMKQYVKIIG